jgi:hypothetical protein
MTTLGARASRIRAERQKTERVLELLLPGISGPYQPDQVRHDFRGSNDLLDVRLGSRRLMLKRGLEPWSADRFATARAMSRLIGERSDILTPDYLPVRVGEWPMLAWWRLPEPTLEELWPGLDAGARSDALRSLGSLLARLHLIPLDRWGSTGQRPPSEEEGHFLLWDLEGRLRRAVIGSWPGALPLVEFAAELAAELWAAEPEPCLAHNDAHLSNVLCSVEDGDVRCVGFLDLEAAGGALPEADLSYLALVHSAPMAGDLGRRWFARVLEGYGTPVCGRRMRLFRLYHLLNIGIHAALAGEHELAAHFADLGREIERS